MAGFKMVLPGSFDDNTLPVLPDDPVMAGTGALVLIDAAHPVAPWAAGVHASGASLPNIALASAKAAIPGASDADLKPTATYSGISATANAKGKLERTGKGGLHVLLTEGTIALSDGYRLLYPAAVMDHIIANPTHAYFASLWGYLSRPTNTTLGWSAASFTTTAPSLSELFYSLGNDGTNYPAGGKRTGFRRRPAGSWRPATATVPPQPFLSNIGVSGYTGTAVSTKKWGKAFGIGGNGLENYPYPGSTSGNASGVFYRFYLEDLTISGRTYSAVDALDNALFQRDVIDAGGRYNGDTYTAPSTIP